MRLTSLPGSAGIEPQERVAVHSAEVFRIRDGFPLLLNESRLSGSNRRYKRLYDRVVGLYDVTIKLFATLIGGGEV